MIGIFATVLAINLPEVITIPLIDQCDIIKFKMERSDWSCQIPTAPNFFYTVSPDPFFEAARLGVYQLRVEIDIAAS